MIAAESTLFGHSLARRQTRRWLMVAFWGGLVPLLCVGFRELFVNARATNALNIAGLFILLISSITTLLGGARAGGWVKPFRAQKQVRSALQPLFEKPQPTQGGLIAQELVMDEREINLRDHFHFVAYSIARNMVLLLFVLCCFLDVLNQELLRQASPLLLFLLTITLWSLPQSIILWTEPDMEEAQ
jgi:hypothetical protein